MTRRVLLVVVSALLISSCTEFELGWWDQQYNNHATDENIQAYCEYEYRRCSSFGSALRDIGQKYWSVAEPSEWHSGREEALQLIPADIASVGYSHIVVPEDPVEDPCLAWIAVGAYDWERSCFVGGKWGLVSRNYTDVSVHTKSDGTVERYEYEIAGEEYALPQLTVDAGTVNWLLPYVWSRIGLSGKPDSMPEVLFNTPCNSRLGGDVACAEGDKTIKTPGDSMSYRSFLHELAHILTNEHDLYNPDVPSIIRSHAGSDMFRCVVQHLYIAFLQYSEDPGACGTQDVWVTAPPPEYLLPSVDRPIYRCHLLFNNAIVDDDGMGYYYANGDTRICDYVIHGKGPVPTTTTQGG